MAKIDSVFDGTLKWCVRCEEEFPRTEENWSKNKSAKDGLQRICKPCDRVRQKENRAKKEKYWEANDAYDGSLKQCLQCEEELPRTKENWHKCKSAKDGLQRICKPCVKLIKKEYITNNKVHWEDKDPYDRGLKECPQCGQKKAKIKENWHKNNSTHDGLLRICVTCHAEVGRESCSRNWALALIKSCRASSKRRNHPAPTIDRDWILSQLEKQDGKCYWSNAKLELGNGKYAGYNQVSIDRLDNSRGYNPDNCVLVTWFINRARSDMSVIEFTDHLKELSFCLSTIYG